MIHILPIWRCHGVKICLHEEKTTRAISLYHILSCAMQPQAHNSRKTAWNSCLPEYYLLNVSCLAGSWNNRWIKGSRKKKKSEKSSCQGAENGSWEASSEIARKLILFLKKKKNLKVLLGGGREGVEKEIPDQSTLLLWNIAKVFQV